MRQHRKLIRDFSVCHHSLVKAVDWPVQNFTPQELACPLTGELYVKYSALHKIQRARDLRGGPLYLNSAHRSEIHNARVGGVPLSQHLKLAFDVPIPDGEDRIAFVKLLAEAGFTSFGFYVTFVHVDERPGKMWFGSPYAKEIWQQAFQPHGLPLYSVPSYLLEST